MAAKQGKSMAATRARAQGRPSEEDWAAFQQEAIGQAEKVDCPLEAFLEGLKVMQGELQDRIRLVEDEISHQ